MGESSGFSHQGSAQATSVTIPQREATAWRIESKPRIYHGSEDSNLFSSSLPVLPHEKSSLDGLDHGVDINGTSSSILNHIHPNGEIKESVEDIDHLAAGSFLPDDEDELLAGITGNFDYSTLPGHLEDLDDYDLFGSGGGLELDLEPQESLNLSFAKATISDNYIGSGVGHSGLSNGVGAIAGEHPYGEHPSRTLFVRNINSNVEDSELRSLFEQYGAIRSMYTACKHRGFVMISYYDIRDARNAMRALQNKPLRRRKLDIHFSIPKDNPSDKDINQGTLVAFNLDPSVSNDDLRQIFGAYGEIKEIRETPYKRHHKFIEFYDVRAAEAALRSLNRSDIAGKRIKLEPSRPGGARKSFMQQLSQDLDQDEGNWAQCSPRENSSFHGFSPSPSLRTTSPIGSNSLPGLASILPSLVSTSVKIAPIGKDQSRSSSAEQAFLNKSINNAGFSHSRSFPENSSQMMPNLGQGAGKITLGQSSSSASDVSTLSGPQFLWGSPTLYSEHTSSSFSSASALGYPFLFNNQPHGYSYANRQTSLMSSSNHNQYHFGSAPSGTPFERHQGFFPSSPETAYMGALSFGDVGMNRTEGGYMINIGNRTTVDSEVGILKNVMAGIGSPSLPVYPSHRLGNLVHGGIPFPGRFEVMANRVRSQRVENDVTQMDNKKQYQLDLDKIASGEDTRTTLMIKNIPNKYTSKMLLATIDENHGGTYDFFYLPIDFKNKCNVGYAFINMVSPSHVIPFSEAFNGKKWEKFNSEKVASLAYARIQGKAALITHFQNSSLMNEDKRCRPIVFHSEGSEAGDQELCQKTT
ncbi:protein MEI2-like 2 isoform X2 [Nymphaea colorata]|uniref:protein MEI2-like 2 isoform X2 n=1 Tax=Nymphaea colorata TaxID=210225 RepID=UPI00129D340F|nr:protein MEI2-like 2 isoform X2 [Nymphaea colorata]